VVSNVWVALDLQVMQLELGWKSDFKDFESPTWCENVGTLKRAAFVSKRK
jgi:hypothetical protein